MREKDLLSVHPSKLAVFILGCVGLLAASGVTVRADSSLKFTRDLSFGMSGADVRSLQILLNSDKETEVASSGPGSTGSETEYFGAKTAAAVARFQEKYAKDVLAPIGLSRGTGYAGAKTRAKFEVIGSASNEPLSSSLPFSMTALQASLAQGVIPQWAAFTPITADDLMIFGLSHTKVRPGDAVTITGYGFDQDTIVHIGSAANILVSATSSRIMYIQVPVIPPGIYPVWVTNRRGTTEDTAPFEVIVGDVTDSRPTIQSVSPQSVHSGDTIHVTADRFDASSNTVYSTLGILRGVNSMDGRTIIFKVDDLPQAPAFFRQTKVNQFRTTFGIGTQAGKSLNYGYFLIMK